MPARALSVFHVTGWEATPYDLDAGDGPHLSRATVRKAFEGDLVGESTAELLLCQADPEDLAAGAGYVASEVVRGTLAGRSGTFVMQHGGLSGGGMAPHTFGHIVPGSGTDGLEGITGTVIGDVAPDGTHTLALDYELP
jgi:hypothetical protein